MHERASMDHTTIYTSNNSSNWARRGENDVILHHQLNFLTAGDNHGTNQGFCRPMELIIYLGDGDLLFD